MSLKWCYVGDLGPGGKLDWGRCAGSNIPSSSMLPKLDELSIYIKIMHLALNGEYCGGVVDFDAYGLKVNGAELRRIIEDCYRAEATILEGPAISQYLKFADNLPAVKYVAFVAVAM